MGCTSWISTPRTNGCLFEQLMRTHADKGVASQALLAPTAITLQPDLAALLTSQLATLRHLGFDVEEFGPSTFQVRAVPALFALR